MNENDVTAFLDYLGSEMIWIKNRQMQELVKSYLQLSACLLLVYID